MSIVEFFEGRSVFLTGATGFLGKALIDKLIRCCPDIGHIYLLVRTKKGKNANQRFKELFNDPVFENMKRERPDFINKVTVVSGDVSLPGLGLSDIDQFKILNEVSIIFHGAATVRFDEKLKIAVAINVFGTKQILELCQNCKKLEAMVHISTAYANCKFKEIEEKIYPAPLTGDGLIKVVESMSNEMVDSCTEKITLGWPNTYAFTKQIAEDLVKFEAESKGLPVTVVRPSIVIGSKCDPTPGWIDNVYGPTGVVVGVGAGLIRTLHADLKNVADLVPVDLVVNCVIAAAWDLAVTKKYDRISTDLKSDGKMTSDNTVINSSKDTHLILTNHSNNTPILNNEENRETVCNEFIAHESNYNKNDGVVRNDITAQNKHKTEKSNSNPPSSGEQNENKTDKIIHDDTSINSPKVYNYVSSSHNSVTWNNFLEMSMKHGREYPTVKAIWYYTINVTKHKFLYYLYVLLLHMVPALLVDSVLLVAGKKPQAIKIYKKVFKFTKVISYFSNREWTFHDNNVQILWSKLSDRDKQTFNFDIKTIDWDDYFKHSILGLRVFLFQDTPDTLAAARRRLQMLHVLHRLVQIMFISFMIWLMWSYWRPVVAAFGWCLKNGAETFLPFSSGQVIHRRGATVSTGSLHRETLEPINIYV